MSIVMEWVPRENGEGQYLKECCTCVYDELIPDFQGPYGRKFFKSDGSICEKHQAIENDPMGYYGKKITLTEDVQYIEDDIANK